jgi:hypothetical protein
MITTNSDSIHHRRSENRDLWKTFENPLLLSDTLAKHLIVDSGQHKDQQKQATTQAKSVTQAK